VPLEDQVGKASVSGKVRDDDDAFGDTPQFIASNQGDALFPSADPGDGGTVAAAPVRRQFPSMYGDPHWFMT
jgi:hypothetical protein